MFLILKKAYLACVRAQAIIAKIPDHPTSTIKIKILFFTSFYPEQ